MWSIIGYNDCYVLYIKSIRLYIGKKPVSPKWNLQAFYEFEGKGVVHTTFVTLAMIPSLAAQLLGRRYMQRAIRPRDYRHSVAGVALQNIKTLLLRASSQRSVFYILDGSLPSRRLLNNCSYLTGTYGSTTLTDSEAKTLLHSDRMN
jgi:hypothetical protein